MTMFNSLDEYLAGMRACPDESLGKKDRLEEEFNVWDNYPIIAKCKDLNAVIERLNSNPKRHGNYLRSEKSVNINNTICYNFEPGLMIVQIYPGPIWTAPIPFHDEECSELSLHPYRHPKNLTAPYSRVASWLIDDICTQLKEDGIPLYLPTVSKDVCTTPGISWPDQPQEWHVYEDIFSQWPGTMHVKK